MASEAKNVGILAMDIYFPPNCVLQVPAPPLFPRAPDSHSPSPLLPLDSSSSGAPGTHALPSVRFEVQGMRPGRRRGHHHTLCVVSLHLRLRGLFTGFRGF